MIPPYMIKITTSDGIEQPFLHADECFDWRMGFLLRWLYNHLIFRMPGNQVVGHEELLFEVTSVSLQHEPIWLATVVTFDFWEQQALTFTLKVPSFQD